MSKKLFIYFILIIPFVLAVTSAYFYRAKVSDTKNIEITTVDKCYEFNLGMDKMSENVTSQEKRSCASLLIAEAGESVIEDKNVLDYKLSFQALEAISKKDFGNLKSFNRFSAIKDFNSCDKLSSNSAEYGCYLRLEEFLQNTFRSQIAQNIQLEKKATLAEDASIAMPKDQEALNEDLLSKENDWYDLYVKSIDRNQRLCYVYSRHDQGSAWYKAIAQCHIELISKDILFMNDFYTHYSSYYKNKYKDF